MKKYYFFLLLLAALPFIKSCSKESSDTKEIEDSIPPKVEFQIEGFNKNTSDPIIVSGSITINIEATDNDKLNSATVSINGETVGQSSAQPFKFVVDISGFSSKIPDTQNFKEYILKIEVSDVSGNVTTVQQNFYIDNDLPSISEVTLENGTVLNGNENVVSFSVSDNQELKQVTAAVGDSPIEVVENSDGGYSMTLNTLFLDDGNNTLRIIAQDYAENTFTYQVDFISDNTGPIIEIEGIMDNEVIGENKTIVPSVTDEYSEAVDLKILLSEDLLFTFDELTDLSFDLLPESLSTGTYDLTFEASDSLGNISTVVVPIDIKRLLITINIPLGYIPQGHVTKRLFYLVSDKDGKLLDFAQGEENSTVKLYSENEFPLDEEFTLSLLEISGYLNGNQNNEIFSVGQLTRQAKSVYELKPHINYAGPIRTSFKITGLDPCANNVLAGGTSYFDAHSSGSEDLEIWNYQPLEDPSLKTDKIYLFLDLYCLEESKYLVFDNPIPENIDKTISVSDFIDTDIMKSSTTFSNEGYGEVKIFGYNSLDDYRSNVNHLLDTGFRHTTHSPGPLQYFWLDRFAEYKHELISKDFVRIARGLPENNYQVPDWSIDHTLTNGIVDMAITAGPHSVGKVIIDSDRYPSASFLDWIYIFDSQNAQQLVLPELPDELQEFQIYDVFKEKDFKIYQSQITDYQGIDTYRDYIQQIILPNKSYQSLGDVLTSKYEINEESQRAFIIGDFFMYR
ncbi:hypothetical protein [Flagellimonas flava]|uniref:hypothetical protein n=1 Tax=Flagellimonas flava TaxID=570519 RepID=UPI003D6487F1